MKKVLSFVLSVAMVICLMPAMAFAADDDAAPATTATATGLSQFSDADSITAENKEAVAVLVGLGIIDGMGDGTFQPDGNLTRAQASKLVATLVKSGDKSDIPAPSADPFTDVAKDYWGAGAIKLGVDNGYINGMGDGTFHPEDQVTTAQLATMLVKILGINSVDANYQWPENVMAWSSLLDLFFDVSQKGANDILNRENAAQMIYNALRATTQVKATTTGSDTQSVDGRSNYEAALNTKFDYRNWEEDFLQLIEKYFPKVTLADDENSEDSFARPVTVWKNGREKITDEIVREPIAVYTAEEVSSKNPTRANDKLKNDLDGYTANARFFVNGEQRRVSDESRNFVETADSDNIANWISQLTGNGILVEVYSDDRDTEINRVIVADYDLATAKPKASDGTIRLTRISDNREYGPYDKKSNFYSKISSAAKDDLVLVAIRGNEVIDAYLPTVVADSAVTKVTNPTEVEVQENDVNVTYVLQDAKATIGGTEYTYGNDPLVVDGHQPADLRVIASDKGTAYTDQYGYLVAYKKAKDIAANWALLKSVYTKEATNDVGETSEDYYGLIVEEDGTIEKIPLLYITDRSDDNYVASQPTVNLVENQFKPLPGIIVDDGGHNWFATDSNGGRGGLLVTYKETADGYKLATIDRNENEVDLSSGVAYSAQKLDKDSKTLDGIYLSSDLSIVTVSGDSASKTKATVASKIKKTYDPLSVDNPVIYQYVWKKIGNNTLVTAIYVTGEAENFTSIYVDKVLGTTTYGTADSKGTEIRYYTDDSDEYQTGIVSEDSNVTNGSWYKVSKIKEGMTVNPLEINKYKEKTIEYGDEDTTAYESGLTVDGDSYVIAENAKVIDLAETEIDSVDALVDEIAKITADEGNDPIRISFTWKADGDDLVISQIYIEKIS